MTIKLLKITECKKTIEEYDSIVNIHNNIWPNKYSVEDLIKSDKKQGSRYLKRYVAWLNDKIVAYATCKDPWEVANPGYYSWTISVDEPYRNQGIGEALYKTIMENLEKENPEVILCETYENFTEATRFLQKRGFTQTIRLPRSLLFLEEFDFTQWVSVLNFVEQQNVEVISMKEYSNRDNDWKRKTWKLHTQCMKDVPSTVEITEMPFEEYDKSVLGELDLQFWMIALVEEIPVGMSILWRDTDEPEKMYTSLTGVIKDYRRMKIATAMKVINIKRAKETHDITVIETENEENNPMFQLNLQLGFKEQPAKLGFEKKMRK